MKLMMDSTKEYASNLNCLFFNFGSVTVEYYELFRDIFNDCVISNSPKIFSETFIDIDIIFIELKATAHYQELHSLETLKDFLKPFRATNELLPIYVIKDDIHKDDIHKGDIHKGDNVSNIIDNCYCLDGVLPKIFDKDKLYVFLYRVLKKISVIKDLEHYTQTLEEQLGYKEISSIVADEKIPETKHLLDARVKDIRFSQDEKIGALEFLDTLDDTIIDKVENISEEADRLISTIYNFEESDTPIEFIPDIVFVIKDIYILIDSIGSFQITARAFDSLEEFLTNLTQEQLLDADKKQMLVTMLLAIVKDFENWIKVIFVEHSTDDIHYLDASFSSNILEIENIFIEYTMEDDDDDLEFF